MSTPTDTKPQAANGSVWQSITSFIRKAKPTGVACEYCGWHGTKDDLLKSPRLNEDGTVYQLMTCPDCLRNGGLVFHD